MSSAQLALFDSPTADLSGTLRDQMTRLDGETRVVIDLVLERAGRFDALGDDVVDVARLTSVKPGELRCVREIRSRGVRRVWYRPARDDERG